MGKNNVNPNHYKIAGRDRQGEDILQSRHKQMFAMNQARERFEHGQSLPFAPVPPAQESAGADAATDDSARAEPAPDRRVAGPARQPARKASTAGGARKKTKTTARGRKTAAPARTSAASRSAKPAKSNRTGAKTRRPSAKTKAPRAKKAASSRQSKGSRPAARRASGTAKKGARRSGRR